MADSLAVDELQTTLGMTGIDCYKKEKTLKACSWSSGQGKLGIWSLQQRDLTSGHTSELEP